jgi:hypothetical protein
VISPLLEETNVLSLGFEFFSVSFARRSNNASAHACARYERLNNVSGDWIEESPVFLQNSLIADCNGALMS